MPPPIIFVPPPAQGRAPIPPDSPRRPLWQDPLVDIGEMIAGALGLLGPVDDQASEAHNIGSVAGDLLMVPGMFGMALGLGKSAVGASEGAMRVFRGGPEIPRGPVTYHTPDPKMAESYVQMYNDRFGDGGALHEATINIKRPAPSDVIEKVAASVGVDNDMYTPASYFDTNLHGEGPVKELVSKLKSQGYDGAILDDIGYGANPQIEGQAHIVFNPVDNNIRAFHGSPHTFDQFSMDKLGTGEGAQAFGHGLYFTEDEGTARYYRDSLSGNRNTTAPPPSNVRAGMGTGIGASILGPHASGQAYSIPHEVDPMVAKELSRMLRKKEITNADVFGPNNEIKLSPAVRTKLVEQYTKAAQNRIEADEISKRLETFFPTTAAAKKKYSNVALMSPHDAKWQASLYDPTPSEVTGPEAEAHIQSVIDEHVRNNAHPGTIPVPGKVSVVRDKIGLRIVGKDDLAREIDNNVKFKEIKDEWEAATKDMLPRSLMNKWDALMYPHKAELAARSPYVKSIDGPNAVQSRWGPMLYDARSYKRPLKFLNTYDQPGGAIDRAAKVKASLANQLPSVTPPKPKIKGSMYEVELSADPTSFLDLDKPLKDQPEPVRRAVMDIVGDTPRRLTSVSPSEPRYKLEDSTGQVFQYLDYKDAGEAQADIPRVAQTVKQPASELKVHTVPGGRYRVVNENTGKLITVRANKLDAETRAEELTKTNRNGRTGADTGVAVTSPVLGHKVHYYDTEDEARQMLDVTGALDNMKGRDVYNMIPQLLTTEPMPHSVIRAGGNQALASQELLARGIQGNRYLNAMSRDPKSGRREYNYVAFDDGIVNILRRYGLLLPVAGTGAAFSSQFGIPKDDK